MSTIRRERREEQLVRELSDIIQNRLKDPRRSWVSITRVELSSDLQYARAYVSILGDPDKRTNTLSMLERASHFVRGELGRRLHVRRVPEIRFVLDENIETSQRVMEILDSLEIPEPPDDEPDGSAQPRGTA
jgi:ribosome-binding factor A